MHFRTNRSPAHTTYCKRLLRTSALTCLSLLMVTAFVPAQAAKNVTDAQIEELLTLTGLDRSIEVLALQMTDLVHAQLATLPIPTSKSEQVTPYINQIDEVIRIELTWQALKPALINAYRDTFTDTDLQDMLAFFSSTAGQKYVNSVPDLQRNALQISQDHAQLTIVPKVNQIVDTMRADLGLQDAPTPPALHNPTQ